MKIKIGNKKYVQNIFFSYEILSDNIVRDTNW